MFLLIGTYSFNIELKIKATIAGIIQLNPSLEKGINERLNPHISTILMVKVTATTSLKLRWFLTPKTLSNIKTIVTVYNRTSTGTDKAIMKYSNDTESSTENKQKIIDKD